MMTGAKRLAWLVCLTLPLLVRTGWGQTEPLVPVGLAAVDITPDYPIRLSGYASRTGPNDGIEQHIWAKAMAFGSDTAGPAVLISVDNCGVPLAVTEEVARRLKTKAGIARSHVAICSTHTHAAPMLLGVLPLLFGQPIPPQQQATIERYTRQLVDWLEQAALAALRDRRPSRLQWSAGRVTFAHNRRTPGGPVDHRLPVLRVIDAEGNLRGILATYACHATTMGGDFNRIHGDWPGYAQAAIQRQHPGTVAMITIGCGADANPQPRRELRLAKQHGEDVAREVQRLLQNPWQPVRGRLDARLEYIDLPFAQLPTREVWQERARSKRRAVAYHAKVQLERLDRGEQLPTSLRYPVQTWMFGDDLAMVFLAGEVVVDYAMRMYREFDSQRLWIHAYANDVPCYIASRRVLAEGGYEPDLSMIYYDRPGPFDPAVEDLIVNTVRRLLRPEFCRSPKRVGNLPRRPPVDATSTLSLQTLQKNRAAGGRRSADLAAAGDRRAPAR